MVTTNDVLPVQPYEGYDIGARLLHAVEADGTTSYTSTFTATERTDQPAPLVFARTLVLSQAQAALTNPWQPGTVPPAEQLDSSLVGIGTSYMRVLIDVVNRGFRAIAGATTISVNDARMRIGMTDAALRSRER